MNPATFLSGQFAATYDQAHWFAPLQAALRGLTAEQAAWKDGSGRNHSIRQIVQHLIFWNEWYLLLFKNTEAPPLDGGNDATFGSDGAESGEDWAETVDRLDAVMKEFRELIATAGEKLESPVREGKTTTWNTVLGDLSIHTAYHTGQIVILRKLQGSWDPAESGVN